MKYIWKPGGASGTGGTGWNGWNWCMQAGRTRAAAPGSPGSLAVGASEVQGQAAILVDGEGVARRGGLCILSALSALSAARGSEERRVGKECRSLWSAHDCEKMS